MLHLQPRQQHRLTLAREEARHAREGLGIAAFGNRRERFLDERQLTRFGDLRSRFLFRFTLVRDVEREDVPICLEKRRFTRGIAHRAVILERRADRRGHGLLELQRGVIAIDALPIGLDDFGCRPQPGKPWIEVRHRPALKAQRMELTAELRRELVRRRLDQRLKEELVGALI